MAQAILKLNAVPQFAASARVVAAVSRLKARILSIVGPSDETTFKFPWDVQAALGSSTAYCIPMCKNLSVSLLSMLQLLNLSEADSISYLDEVANSPGSLDLAKSVALEVSFLSIL